jgi:hypothetical protein
VMARWPESVGEVCEWVRAGVSRGSGEFSSSPPGQCSLGRRPLAERSSISAASGGVGDFMKLGLLRALTASDIPHA